MSLLPSKIFLHFGFTTICSMCSNVHQFNDRPSCLQNYLTSQNIELYHFLSIFLNPEYPLVSRRKRLQNSGLAVVRRCRAGWLGITTCLAAKQIRCQLRCKWDKTETKLKTFLKRKNFSDDFLHPGYKNSRDFDYT